MKEVLREKSVWLFALACLLALAVAVFSEKIDVPLAGGSFVRLYQEALSSQFLLFLLPLAASLPMGAIFVKERKSGFLKMYLMRMDKIEYIKRKIFQVYMGGVLPLFSSAIAAFLLCFFFLYPLEKKGAVDWESVKNALLMVCRICLTGGIFAELAGVFSAVFENYYLSYGLPFVCYYLLMILKERYLPKFYALYPTEWILAGQDWGVSGNGIWLFLLAASMAMSLLHGIVLQIRLREI